MEPLSTIRRGEKKGVPSSYAHDGGGLDAGKKGECVSEHLPEYHMHLPPPKIQQPQ